MEVFEGYEDEGWQPKVGDTFMVKTSIAGQPLDTTLMVVTEVGETVRAEQVGSALPAKKA